VEKSRTFNDSLNQVEKYIHQLEEKLAKVLKRIDEIEEVCIPVKQLV